MSVARVRGTLDGMPKRKPPAADQPEPGSPVLYVRMPPRVQAAFDRMVAEDPTDPKRQDLGVTAIILLLKERGYWPPPKE